MNEQLGFVIERHLNSQLHYWNGRSVDKGSWDSRHDEAIRFARREDGDRVLSWLLEGIGRVVEHAWITTKGEHHMTREQLKQEALDCLSKAFKGEEVPAHVVQAALGIVLAPDPR